MKVQSILKTLLVTIVACGLFSCGEDGPVQTEDPITCGEGTRPFGQSCVPDVECVAGELQLDDGRCIRADYCGPGTTLNNVSGRCQSPILRCSSETVEEEGECLPDAVVTCGEGTVSSGTVCVPYSEICGPGTTLGGPLDCRPAEEICGEGTVYDVSDRRCIALSNLTCGPRTIAVDGQCLASSDYFAGLAETPNLTLREDSQGTLELAPMGEKTVFAGSIAEPELSGSTILANHDRISFDAQAGQWLRLVLYSQGVPDLGMHLTGPGSYFRSTDRGANIEIHHDLLIPADGTYEIKLNSLAQLNGNHTFHGGEGWDYVGFLEVLDPPEAQELDLVNDTFSGSVSALRENFYRVEGIEEGTAIAMLFSTLPLTADGELMIWSDSETLAATRSLDNVVTFDAPSDPFYLVMDRREASGALRNFTATARTGLSLGGNEAFTFDLTLEPGDYAGLFQFNLTGRTLRGRIKKDGDVLTQATSLGSTDASSGTRALFWFSEEGGDYELELFNTALTTLGFFSPTFVKRASDPITGIDGSEVNFTYSEALPALQRHYMTLEVDYDDLLGVNLTSGSGRVILYDLDQNEIASGINGFTYIATPGNYLLAVEAQSDLPNGFSLRLEESQIFEVTGENTTATPIPDNLPAGVNSVIQIANCPTILEIDMDINITHTWRGELIIRLTSPGGETKVLKSRFGGLADNIIGNFNQTLGASSGFSGPTAVPISDFEGSSGSGEWTLNVSDHVNGDTGTLNSWQLNLLCEG